MYVATWAEGAGWDKGTLKPYGPLQMMPSAQVCSTAEQQVVLLAGLLQEKQLCCFMTSDTPASSAEQKKWLLSFWRQ